LKILISTWGNPWKDFSKEELRWVKTTYEYEDKKDSHSSFQVLYEKLKPNKSIIISLDTLADSSVLSNGNNITYKDIKNNAEEQIKLFIEKKLNMKIKDIKIFVLPGVGTFKKSNNNKTRIFKGLMLDYYYCILYRISKFIIELIEKNPEDEKIIIHLDLTHGINFMPVLTYRAIREIAGILAFTKNVIFNVYNSDPYNYFAKNTILKIQKVESTEIIMNPYDKLLSGTNKYVQINKEFCEKYKNNEVKGKIFRSISNHCKLDDKRINAFLSSIYNGFPLALFTFFPNGSAIQECIDYGITLFEGHTTINTSQKDILFSVEHNVNFTKDFATYIITWLSTKIIKNIILNPYNIEVPLKCIKDFSEKLYSKNKRIISQIEKEIFSIEKKENITDKWEIYAAILGGCTSGEIDFRNFMAHSGFEKNAICIRKDNNEIILKYKKELIKTIRKHCINGLKRN